MIGESVYKFLLWAALVVFVLGGLAGVRAAWKDPSRYDTPSRAVGLFVCVVMVAAVIALIATAR